MKLRLFEIVMDSEKCDIKHIEKILDSKEAIKDWAYILHDKDETREHYHIAVRLRDSYDTKYVSDWFGIPENMIERVKGRWSDMLKYLVHENAIDKYQYPLNNVVSNFDWVTEKDKGNTNQRKQQIINDIIDGRIKEYNYTEHITPHENDIYSRSIEKAFKYRLDKVKGVERNMKAVYIVGDSGVGKTTYAKQIAREHHYSVYISSGSNDVLDDYKGQECIILDDLRPSSLGLADLLKMLDNHTASTVKSRYRNKVLECKMIIITTTLDINTFFRNVFKEDEETIIQLKRRCQTHVRMKLDKIYVKQWDDRKRAYSQEYEFINPVEFLENKKELTEKEVLSAISDTLKGLVQMVDDMKETASEKQITWDDIETKTDED